VLPRNILFVDDEPTLRVTLPAILQQRGHSVTTAATVGEALKQIQTGVFDVLISDLNIGEPGDGFTVVSAMRRTQPNCLNLILTGYPAFEAALDAIRRQVDHFLVKPAQLDVLVSAIEEKISRRKASDSAPLSLAEFLRGKGAEIIRRTLRAMKQHQQLVALPLSDGDRIDHLPGIFTRLTDLLELPERSDIILDDSLKEAAHHGSMRNRQGYSIDMLIEDRRLLGNAIYDAVRENLLALDLSRVIPDLQRINDSLDLQLRSALLAYLTLGNRSLT